MGFPGGADLNFKLPVFFNKNGNLGLASGVLYLRNPTKRDILIIYVKYR
jgi:hypothetical protein